MKRPGRAARLAPALSGEEGRQKRQSFGRRDELGLRHPDGASTHRLTHATRRETTLWGGYANDMGGETSNELIEKDAEMSVTDVVWLLPALAAIHAPSGALTRLRQRAIIATTPIGRGGWHDWRSKA